MKRLFLLAVALLVLLSGCGKNGNRTPDTTVPQQTQPDPGWYIPDSETERASDGAVRVYNVPAEDVLWITGIGDDLLLASGGETPSLTVLSGENCVTAATLIPEFDIRNGVQSTAQGIVYYDANTNEAVYLDQTLQVISRIELPEKPDSTPLFAEDSSAIYYCVGNDIRAYDTTRNIARPVKNQLVKSQQLQNIALDGNVLSCLVEYENGEQGVVYLDTQTGETISTDKNTLILDSDANTFVAVRQDGVVRQEIYGMPENEIAALALPDDAMVIPAIGLNGMIAVSSDNINNTKLSLYDFSSGAIRAEVVASKLAQVKCGYTDKWNRCVWLLGTNRDGEMHIYRWDASKSSVSKNLSYKTPVFTAENPDTDGISLCKKQISELNKNFGVEIRIWKDALEETGEYTIVGEYQTEAIEQMLEELEKAMLTFPDKFLRKSATKPLQICLVRRIGWRSVL